MSDPSLPETSAMPASGDEVEALRAGLEGVPDGPWAAYMGRYEVRVAATYVGDQEIIAMCATGRNAGVRAAHIARCSPYAIRRLLALLSERDRELAEARAAAGGFLSLTCDNVAGAIDLISMRCAAAENSAALLTAELAEAKARIGEAVAAEREQCARVCEAARAVTGHAVELDGVTFVKLGDVNAEMNFRAAAIRARTGDQSNGR